MLLWAAPLLPFQPEIRHGLTFLVHLATCRLANSLYSRHLPLLAALMLPAVAAFPLWDAGRLCGLLQAAPGIQVPMRRLYRWAATFQ